MSFPLTRGSRNLLTFVRTGCRAEGVRRRRPRPRDRSDRPWPHRGILALILANLLASRAAAFQEPPRFALVDRTVFDSSQHPASAVSGMGWLADALLLPGNRLAFVDGSTQAVHFFTLPDGSVTTIQPEGDPSESAVRLVDRLEGGDVAIVTNRRLEIVAPDGAVVRTAELARMSRPVAVLSDGVVLVRRTTNSALLSAMGSDGSYRSSIRYQAVSPGHGTSAVLAEALGDDRVKLTVNVSSEPYSTTTRLIFGHRLMEARLSDELIVAQTDLDAIVSYDRDGRPTGQIPMPPRRARVSSAQIAAQRQQRMAEAREDRVTLREMGHVSRYVSAAIGESITFLGVDSAATLLAEARHVAPPIDRLLTDLSGRLWVRLFPMPDDDTVHWWVWNPRQSIYEFSLVLPRAIRLMDAVADRVLLYISGDGHRPQLQLTEIRSVP